MGVPDRSTRSFVGRLLRVVRSRFPEWFGSTAGEKNCIVSILDVVESGCGTLRKYGGDGHKVLNAAAMLRVSRELPNDSREPPGNIWGTIDEEEEEENVFLLAIPSGTKQRGLVVVLLLITGITPETIDLQLLSNVVIVLTEDDEDEDEDAALSSTTTIFCPPFFLKLVVVVVVVVESILLLLRLLVVVVVKKDGFVRLVVVSTMLFPSFAREEKGPFLSSLESSATPPLLSNTHPFILLLLLITLV